MADQLTIGELFRRQLVTSEQIDAAVAAYLARPNAGSYTLTHNITVDIAAALRELGWTKAVATDSALSSRGRRIAVRTAILLVGVGVTPAASARRRAAATAR